MIASFHRLSATLLLLPLVARVALAQEVRPGGRNRSGELVSLPVRVVDVAGGRAYVEPGSERGLRQGDALRFPQGKLRIVGVTKKWAVVSLGRTALSVGARGSAEVPAQRPETIILKLPTPAPLSSFRGQWRSQAKPAESQHPTPVPLRERRRSANRFFLQDAFFGAVPFDGRGRFVGNEMRGRLHYEPLVGTPFALDLDAGARTFAGDGFPYRPGASARQVLHVRELSLAYGRKADFRAALGRLRAASTFVGPVDGLQLEAPLTTDVRLTAFGGGAPQVFSGSPSTDVLRFGGELAYDVPTSSVHPRLVVGGYASRFEGTLDERRIYAALDLLPTRSFIGVTTEVSFFDAGNPWGANEVELSLGSLDADFVFGVLHVGGRFELRRPDRSRFLQSLLPVEWLCWTDPALARAPCKGDSAQYGWVANAGVRIGKFWADWGAQSHFTRGTDATNFGGFTTLRFLDLVGATHLDFGMTAYTGSLQRELAATVAPGMLLAGGAVDVTLRYRGAATRYRADLGFGYGQSLGLGLWLSPHDSLSFDVAGDWVKELGIDAAVFEGVVTYRPGG